MPLELVHDITTRVVNQYTSMDQAIYVRFGSANEVVGVSASLVIDTPGDSDLGVVYRRPMPSLLCNQGNDFIVSYESSFVSSSPMHP